MAKSFHVPADKLYQPFSGLSAWFSCCVNVKIISEWSKHGGLFADEHTAKFLFSDGARSMDTKRVYSTQIEVAVLQTSWIKEVLQRRCQVREVALGHHLLLPDWLELEDIPGTNEQVGGKQLDSRLYTKVREQEEVETEEKEQEQVSEEEKMWLHLEKKAANGYLTDATHIDTINTEEIMDELPGTTGINQKEDKTSGEQLWFELERKAVRSILSEVIHIHNINTDEPMCDFDCSKPHYQIRLIN